MGNRWELAPNVVLHLWEDRQQDYFIRSHDVCRQACSFASGNVELSVKTPRYSQRSVVFSNPNSPTALNVPWSPLNWMLDPGPGSPFFSLYPPSRSYWTSTDGGSHILFQVSSWRDWNTLSMYSTINKLQYSKTVLISLGRLRWLRDWLWMILFCNYENVKYTIL